MGAADLDNMRPSLSIDTDRVAQGRDGRNEARVETLIGAAICIAVGNASLVAATI
jgi:hypothetical protein